MSRALTSTEFLNALRQGIHGKVAVTYFEWAGASDQQVIVPWRVVEGPESAGSVANEISQAPMRRAAAHLDFRRAAVRHAACSTPAGIAASAA